MKDKNNNDLLNAALREKRKNYVILYTVTLVVWLILLLISFLKGYFKGEDFIVNLVNNLIGILPPILIFDFFNEKLSKDSSAIEVSNKITETLMSNPETLDLFTEDQKKNFIKSTISSIVKDETATEMVNDSLRNYLFSNTDYRLKTEFNYSFELYESPPAIYDDIFDDRSKYFYVQEKLHYRVKYLSETANNIDSNIIKIGFIFDNKSLDSALRESNINDIFKNCIFRESLDLAACDVQKLKEFTADKAKFQQLFKIDLQIDCFKGVLDDVIISDKGFVCTFKVDHDKKAMEHSVRIIFHMPKKWGSLLEVALVDPTKAPKISVSYPEDMMNVDMYSFLSKGEESSLEVAHEHLNGIFDIVLNNEWIYPISGMIFNINKKL